MAATAALALVSDEIQLLNAVEREVIGIFVSAVKMLGLPKSVGEIYGLLFISPDPLALDALVERLTISKGSASQGLRFLRSFGAIRQVYIGGDRRDHYTAETDLKRLAAGFVRTEVTPRMTSGGDRLLRANREAKSLKVASGNFYKERLAKLQQWHKRGQSLLPLVSGMLE
jgi:HTH-type transcriptional regulator, glycine betaine synthesis regulator